MHEGHVACLPLVAAPLGLPVLQWELYAGEQIWRAPGAHKPRYAEAAASVHALSTCMADSSMIAEKGPTGVVVMHIAPDGSQQYLTALQ